MKQLRCHGCGATTRVPASVEADLEAGYSARVGAGWSLRRAQFSAGSHRCSELQLWCNGVSIENVPLPDDAPVRAQPTATLLAEVARALAVTHPARAEAIVAELERRTRKQG